MRTPIRSRANPLRRTTFSKAVRIFVYLIVMPACAFLAYYISPTFLGGWWAGLLAACIIFYFEP